MEIPQLIIDLAIMLSTAAVVTIVFKKLKIPTILGYILAGFLIGPHFPMFLEIESVASIETWSEIGVIIILFHIGLEFDFHKIANMGSTAIVTAWIKISGVMAVGYGFGMLIGLDQLNAIFLGAMLSISSTVVIQKCIGELSLEKEKFSGLVMGELVMEDVISVFLMVILTSLSVTSGAGNSGNMLVHFALLICYLVIWLLLGIFIIPSFLDKTMKYMSDEMLTLLSLGICFLMALLANRIGFSMELGAFLAGSFFAGTTYVKDIERVTVGIKDVFGSVFFLSVGMMVDPDIIAEKWTTIVPVAIIAVVAKLLFATIGMLLSGQEINTAVRGGAALAPIGEFSFIIASLGVSLGVMNEYLYPVIVAASILTIIITPTCIKKSSKLVQFIEKRIPAKLKRFIDNYTSDDQDKKDSGNEWHIVINDSLLKMVIFGSIMLVTALAGCVLLAPALSNLMSPRAAKIVSIIAIYSIMAIFIRPMMGTRSAAFTKLWLERLANRPPLMVIVIAKIAIIVAVAYIPLNSLFDIKSLMIVPIIAVVIFLVVKSDYISSHYLKLEARFLSNLNQKTLSENNGERSSKWLDEDYSIFSWIVPEEAGYVNKTIAETAWGKLQGIYVVKIRKNGKNIAMPSASTVIKARDKVYVIGERPSLEIFHKTLNIGEPDNMRTLKEFLDAGYPDEDHALECLALRVRGTESYVDKPLKKSGINAKIHCMVLGIERGAYATTMPDANMRIEEGDILWIIGTSDNLKTLAAHSVGDRGLHSSQV